MTKRILGFLMAIVICLTGCHNSSQSSIAKSQVEELKKQALNNHNTPKELNFKLPEPVVYHAASGENDDNNGLPIPNDGKYEKNINPLNKYPINDYQYVGVLRDGDKIYAYLLAPDGGLYKIHEGDLIGTTHAQVIEISDDQIKLQEKQMSRENKIVQHIKILELKGNQDG